MKTIMTLIAALFITAGCLPKEEMATVGETCEIAGRYSDDFALLREYVDFTTMLEIYEKKPSTPLAFWEPILNRVYSEHTAAFATGTGTATAEFRSMIKADCIASNQQLTRAQFVDYYRISATFQMEGEIYEAELLEELEQDHGLEQVH